MTQMSSTIPFSGFYYTVHDHAMDTEIESMFQDESGDPNSKLSGHVMSECDWQQVRLAYAKEYTEQLSNESKVKFSFESLSSPKDYAFDTDRIFVTIDLDEVNRLRKEVNEETFSELAKEKFTSRSGFVSFYSPDVASWGELSTWDHNQIGTLVEAYITDNLDMTQDDLMESACCNGSITEWIETATNGIERYYRINDYLRQRKARK